ncbi:modulator of FtsH protease [Microterricola gilva]|uniref:Modulator of FtsH protease n=1 Tax=Microterricola gilva TaxID=393267 RepID=A0A4Q8AMN5_9MICO|nr:hypothetical protein [Microterricola gilva]RZU65189.1 modulator of FtsH protease [Microterricola gilva]
MLSEWTDFFVASAGAAAALAGLIIVAVSGDVDRVIAIPGMASRAGVAIALLVMSTLIALGALIPHSSALGYGALVVLTGLVATLLATLSLLRLVRSRTGSLSEAFLKGAFGVLPALLAVIGGVLVMLGTDAGLGRVATGILLAVVFSVISSWVILIEIRR